MSQRYALIGVEGNHDQVFISKILCKLLDFSKWDEKSDLDRFWRKFIPNYPPRSGKLYVRLDMPSILHNDELSIAIYAGEGSNLITNFQDKLSDIDISQLSAFGIVADADKSLPEQVVSEYFKGFKEYFPEFPKQGGLVVGSCPKLGVYVLPNNLDSGVVDSLLCECGHIAYPEFMKRANTYIDVFTESEIKHWKPFDKEKATIASVVSILKPGKTNTVSISDNEWISREVEQQLPKIKALTKFLKDLLGI